MTRKLRKRVVGMLAPEQAAHFRKSRAEAEAEIPKTRTKSRRLADSTQQTVPLHEVIKAIRAQRLRSNLPANTVAEKMQMDTGNFARLESGQGNPTIETVSRLADAVGVELRVSVKSKDNA
jgi:ribosome-binding protein aMBF1 (putative translation factor)